MFKLSTRWKQPEADGSTPPAVLSRLTVGITVSFILIGFVLSQVIAGQIRADALDTAQFHSQFVEETIVAHALGEGSLNQPLTGAALERLDKIVNEQVLRAGVVRLKIWNSSGIIVYSDEHRLIGRHEPSRMPDLSRVLSDEVESQDADMSDPINEYERELGPLFETYVPLQPAGAARPEAVAQFFQLKGPIDSKISRARATVTLVVFGALALLLALILPRIRRHTKAVVRQNRELEHRTKAMARSSIQTIEMLNRLANAKDSYTGGHIGRVAELSTKVGLRMGLDNTTMRALALASEFHDIGKVAIPDAILNKPGPLTSEERAELEKHPAIGVGIVEGSELFEPAIPGILHHHERFDGNGYPAKLARWGIPVIARIITAVDAYDAMTSDRPYRKALAEDEARRRLVEGAGTQFCAETVSALLEVLASESVAEPV